MDNPLGTAKLNSLYCYKCAIFGERRVFGKLSDEGDLYVKRTINNQNSSYSQDFVIVLNDGGVFCNSCGSLVYKKETFGTQTVISMLQPVTEMTPIGTAQIRILTNLNTSGTVNSLG